MPKVVTPLSNNQCKHAKDKEFTLSHSGGMGLRVMPNGKKEWIFRYTKPFTKTRTAIQLGIYPATSIKQAQDKRDTYLQLIAGNKDPLNVRIEQDHKAKLHKDNTFKYVAEQWIEDKKRMAKVSPETAKDIWNSLENHIFPKLGKHSIDELKPKMVAGVIIPLEDKGSLELVKRLCQRINEVMAFALNEEIITDNPLAHIKRKFKAPSTNQMMELDITCSHSRPRVSNDNPYSESQFKTQNTNQTTQAALTISIMLACGLSNMLTGTTQNIITVG